MLETTHRKQPKSTFVFFQKRISSSKHVQFGYSDTTPSKSNMSPKKGDHFKGKDRTPTTIFSVTSLEEIPSGAENIHLPKLMEDTEKCRHLCYIHPQKLIQDGTREVKLHLGDKLFTGHGF